MPVNEQALHARRRLLFDRLRALVGARLAAIWLGLDGYVDQGRWVSLAAPIVQAGQERAVSIQTAYLEAILGLSLIVNRQAVLERAAIDVTEPFIAFATALDNQQTFDVAREAGAARATGIGESAVTWAARAAATPAEPHVEGWIRTPDPDPCEWCLVVSTQRYHTVDSASFGHLHCSCDVDPIIDGFAVGREVPSGHVVNHQLLADLKASGAVARVSASRARRRAAAR